MIRGANIVALLASLGVKNHAIVLREANIILFPNVSLFQKVCVILMLNLYTDLVMRLYVIVVLLLKF